jgi:outer membrane protein
MDGRANAFCLRPRWRAALLALAALGQSATGTETPPSGRVEDGLAQVVDDALAANLELRAGSATVQQRLAVLDQARARYLPVLDFAARYSVADGGRTIDFPAGDLLNPVYETLDELLIARGEPPRFSRVANQEIELLRSREQETKLVLEQPIYEPRLAPNVEAGRQQLQRAEADLAALRARVVRDTRQAYYQWLAGQQAVVVLEATLELARANLDANSSLYRNGKVTRDLV